MLGSMALATATSDAEAQVLAPRGDGTYQRYNVPDARPNERMTLQPNAGARSSTVYGADGRSLGSARSNSNGDVVIYDKQGRRVSR
jgi:hypothetical protein